MHSCSPFYLLSFWRPYDGAGNPPCRPTVKDVSFTQFMESRNCEVDEKLLKLFSSEEFNNSIANNVYANFMCIGFIDALALVPDDICDLFDPLSDIPDDDFCSSTKIAYMQKIVNANVFDNMSNIFIVTKFTEENCKALCEGDTNQLCWAFGIIAKAVFKHLSTQAPTIATEPSLPALIASQDDDVPQNSDDGDIDNEDNNSDGGSDDYTDKSETTTDNNMTDYFEKDKGDSSSDNVHDIPDTKDDDVEDNDNGDVDNEDTSKGWNSDKPDSTPTITENVNKSSNTMDYTVYANTKHDDAEDNDKDSGEYNSDIEKHYDQSLSEVVDQDSHTDDINNNQTYDYNDPVDGKDAPSTSSTTEAAATTAYHIDDYDQYGYDHDYDDGDGNGYQYFMAILLLIFLLVVAEYFAAHKV